MSATKAGAIEFLPFPLGSEERSQPQHSVQFYTEDAFLVDAISRMVGSALGAGDPAVIIATKSHRDGVASCLKSRGLDVSKAAQQGRYVALDARETLGKLLLNDYPDADLFNRVIGPVMEKARAACGDEASHAVAFGEMVALLWEEHKIDAAIRLEQLWNELAKTHRFSLRCAYPITQFHRLEDSAPLMKICAEHSSVIPAENYTALENDEARLRDIARLQQKEQVHDTLYKANELLEKEMSERREIERKLLESEESLRELSRHILRMQDEERRRIGIDLHDSVGQYLSVLKMHLDDIAVDIPGTKASERLADCVNLVEESLREVQTISYLLHPPMLEEVGLKSAIPWYLDGFTKRSGIRTSFEISPALGRLPQEVEVAVFRVVQESLTNVHRHSGSGVAQVLVLLQAGKVRVEVRDKGKGLTAETLSDFLRGSGLLSLGLRGMSERVRQLGGKLELFSGEGTTVVVTIPLVENVTPRCAEIKTKPGSESEVIYPDQGF